MCDVLSKIVDPKYGEDGGGCTILSWGYVFVVRGKGLIEG